MGKTQISRKKEQEKNAPNPGCICPEGCVVKESIDAKNPPSDAVLLSCSNDCLTNRYVHGECMEKWEAKLCKLMSTSSGRCSRWTDTQVRANLWNKKGYECTMHVCRCPCTGFLRREETIDVAAIVPHASKPKAKAKLPKLETNVAPVPTKNKPLVASSRVETPAHPKSILKARRSLTPDDDEMEKPAPRSHDGAGFVFANDGDDEERPQQFYARPAPPPMPNSPLQFPSLPVATPPAPATLPGGAAAATACAWGVPADALLSTADQLTSALHALIVKKSGPVQATDVSLLDLVQNRLSVSLQTELADCGGLLPWIRRQRGEDLCAIADKIMTGRIARELGYMACSSGASETSTRSRTTSGISSMHALNAMTALPSVSPYLAPIGTRQRTPPQPVLPERPTNAIYDISPHLSINFDFTYDTAYAIEGLKLSQIACKIMLK